MGDPNSSGRVDGNRAWYLPFLPGQEGRPAATPTPEKNPQFRQKDPEGFFERFQRQTQEIIAGIFRNAETEKAPPVTIKSPACLNTTVQSLQELFQSIQSQPENFVQTQILPQFLDQGSYAIQFEGPMIPGQYRGGVVVNGPTWIHADLKISGGKVEGALNFYPHIIKQDAIIPGVWGDATLNTIKIRTDEDGNIRFVASATFLEIEQDATKDLTELLLGERMEFVPGPLSNFVRLVQEHAKKVPPENMVNALAAGFRISANPLPTDPELPPLGDNSHVSLRWNEIRISPDLAIHDIQAGVTVVPNPETGGFTVTVPEAGLRDISHDNLCEGRNFSSYLNNARLTNIRLDLVPLDPSNPLKGMYIKEGSGSISLGRLSVGSDIRLASFEGDQAISFSLTGDAQNNLAATVTIPRLGIEHTSLELGSLMFGNNSLEVTLADALLTGGQFTVNLNKGQVTYNGSFTPGLGYFNAQFGTTFQLLAGVTLEGLKCQPIHVEGSTENNIHHVEAPHCEVSSEETWSLPGVSHGDAAFRINHFDVSAGINAANQTTTGATAHLSSHLDVRTASVLKPLPVSVTGGAIDTELSLGVAPGSGIDHTGLDFTTSLNLRRTKFDIAGFSLDLSGMLGASGRLQVDQGALNLDTNFRLAMAGAHHPGKGEATLTGHLGIHDIGESDDRTGERVVRHFDITDLQTSLGARYQKLALTSPRGMVSDGKPAAFEQTVLLPGIHASIGMNGQNLGLEGQATINLSLHDAIITTPMGSFEASGQLVGTVNVVNISDDPAAPLLRPVIGSLRLELRDGTVKRISGKNRGPVLKGTLDIHDDTSGVMHLTAKSPLMKLPVDVPILSGLSTRGGIDLGRITLSPEALRFRTAPDGREIPYYEFSAVDEISAPAFLMTTGDVRARGYATLKRIQSGHPLLKAHATVPFGRHDITLPENPLGLSGDIGIRGGSLAIDSSLEKIAITLRPPAIKTHFTMTQDGITYDFDGLLASQSQIQTRIDIKRKALSIAEKDKAPKLSGDFTITARDAAGKVLGAGKATLTSRYELSGSVDTSTGHLTLRVPDSGITGTITEPITIREAGVELAAGSVLNIPTEGLEVTADVHLRELSADFYLKAAQLGPLTVALPGSPLAKAKVPLKGPLDASASLKNPNTLHVRVDRSGVQLDFTKEAVFAKVLAAIGEDLKLDLTIPEAKGDLSAHVRFDGKTDIFLRDIAARVDVNGFVMLEGEKLSLDGIVLQNLLKEASLHYDPSTKRLSLTVARQTTMPSEQPPTNINDWLSWPREKWAAYRDALNQPERQFLSVIEEPLANVPMVPVPPGKGRIYVKIDQPEFSVNLKDYARPMDAVAALFGQVGGAVGQGMIREYPVPSDEMLKDYTGQDIVYNDQQRPEGTFFILGESDTTKLIVGSLGLAPGIMGNRRIDLGDFSKSAVLGRYFQESLPGLIETLKSDAAPDFPNWPVRALAILGHLNTDFPSMVMRQRVYDGELTRASSIINFDHDSTRGRDYQDEKHVNATSLTYLPYDAGRVSRALKEKEGLAKVMDWLPGVDSIDFSVSAGVGKTFPVTHFSVAPESGNADLKRASGRLYTIPLKDSAGQERSVVVFDHLFGFAGDPGFLKGRGFDFSETADPLGIPLTTLMKKDPPSAEEWPPPAEAPKSETKPEKPFMNIERLGPIMERAQSLPPSAALPVIANGLMTEVVNSLIHRIKTGQWIATPPIYQVPSTPAGIKIPPEYLAIDVEKGLLKITLTKETSAEFVRKTLASGFGISEADAAQLLPGADVVKDEKGNRVKETPLKDLYAKSAVKDVLADYDEFVKFSRSVLEMTPLTRRRFRSHGTIFLTLLKDLRERVSRMSPGDFQFRDFNHPMFFGSTGPTREQSYDNAVNAMYFLMPSGGGVSVDKLAATFGAPESFHANNPGTYKRSDRVDPSKDSLAGISEELKPYYDCAAAEKDGDYCAESDLDAGKILRYRIRVPKKPIDGYRAPWDIMMIPGMAIKDNGMYANSGEWSFYQVTVKGEKRILGMNLRMLNTNMPNEQSPQVQKFAFGQMAGFLSGMYKGATGRDLGFGMTGTVKYKE